MKLHQIRNATCVIESGNNCILIDPMLSGKATLPPFTYFKYQAKRNPLTDLPQNTPRILDKITHCLVTHSQKWGIEALTHTDHFDPAGRRFLQEHNIPVVCPAGDAAYMQKHGLAVAASLTVWQVQPFLDGRITAVPALHGHSWMNRFMANGAGFFLELPDAPSIYIAGDTVYTEDVHRALTELKPDIAVVAAGGAGLDIGGPILMPLKEIVRFAETAPGKVVANHMEALNHCPATRNILRQTLEERGLLEKTAVPEDGETLVF